MGKRRNQSLTDSDESSDNESASNSESDTSQPGSDSDSVSAQGKAGTTVVPKCKRTKNVSNSSDSSSEDDSDEKSVTEGKIEVSSQQSNVKREEGEVSDSKDDGHSDASRSSSSNTSSESEFDDGYDENLMADDYDRKRLNGLTEKERETEIYRRFEQREMMRTRWEINRKLKLRLAQHGDITSQSNKVKGRKRNIAKKAKKKSVQPAAAVQKNVAPTIQAEPKAKVVEAPNEASSTAPAKAVKPTKTGNTTVEKQPQNAVDYFAHKERPKERKTTLMNRTEDKRSNAMARLKANREGKAKREKEEAKQQAEREREDEKKELEAVSAGKSFVKLKASEIYSDDSGSGDWDDENPSDKRSRSTSSIKDSSESEDEKKPEKAPLYISTREDLNKLRLSRFKMERFINLPIFERVVMNCFVRIGIGKIVQKPVYRVAEIVGVVETPKIYTLGKTRTNRGLRLKHGAKEYFFRLEFISNQEFTEIEFINWRDSCAEQNVTLPTMDLLERKQLDIKEAVNYEYKEEDVDKIVEEKNRFRNRPTNYAMRKTCLMEERDAAMLRDDYDLANDLGKQIKELESRASELDKKRSSSISLISYINDRNRKRNMEDAEKAIMEEARANKGMKISDPFTRRITQPRMAFKPVKKNDEVVFQQPQALPPMKRKLDDSVASSSKVTDPKEYCLYSLHDFDIDLDVTLPVTAANVLPTPVPKVAEPAPKRSVSLENYKKKRGLI